MTWPTIWFWASVHWESFDSWFYQPIGLAPSTSFMTLFKCHLIRVSVYPSHKNISQLSQHCVWPCPALFLLDTLVNTAITYTCVSICVSWTCSLFCLQYLLCKAHRECLLDGCEWIGRTNVILLHVAELPENSSRDSL